MEATISEQTIIATISPANEISVVVSGENSILADISSVGSQRLKGDPGQAGGTGLPAGGTAGQRLVKIDSTDYNVEWRTQTAAGLNHEVQINKAGVLGSDANFLYDDTLQAMSVGKPAILPDNPIAAGGDIDSYLQINIQNRNNGISASADYIATADNGSDIENYADLGICNSAYNVPEWDVVVADDTYVFGDGGNVVVGSLTPGKKVKFFIAKTIHEAHPDDVVFEADSLGINIVSGMKVRENGFNLSDIVTICSGAVAEAAAFAAGSKIVIRSDLI